MMQYTQLGRTGFRVSKMGLGGAPFAGGYDRQVSASQVQDILAAAEEVGINFLDTAANYGRGESERKIGQALKGRRDKFIVATKGVMYGDRYTYANMMASVEESLKRLQLDHIDLIQLHECEQTTLAEAEEEIIPAFLKLREEGKVRAFGVNGGRIEALMPYVASGHFHTAFTHSRYTLIDQSASETLFPVAREHGVALINGSVLMAGVLADQPADYMQGSSPVTEEANRRMQQIDFLRSSQTRSLVEPALRFCMSNPDIAVTVIGVTSAEAVVQNANYCDGVGLPAEEDAHVRALFKGLPPLFS